MAHALHSRGRTVVGLTSPRNVGFVEATGYYTSVAAYDALGSVPAKATLHVDFAGDRALRRRVHEHFGDRLERSVVVGDTHRGKADGEGEMPGPRPEFFFAPTHLATRMRDTSPGGFLDRYAHGWTSFVGSTAKWLRYVEESGPAVTKIVTNFVAGRVDPAEGVILRL